MLLRGFISGLIITAKRKQSFCQRNALQNSEHLLHINEEDQSHYKCFHGGYLSSNYRGGLHQRSRERLCGAHKDAYNTSLKIIRVPRELNHSNVAEVLKTLPLHKIQQKE